MLAGLRSMFQMLFCRPFRFRKVPLWPLFFAIVAVQDNGSFYIFELSVWAVGLGAAECDQCKDYLQTKNGFEDSQ